MLLIGRATLRRPINRTTNRSCERAFGQHGRRSPRVVQDEATVQKSHLAMTYQVILFAVVADVIPRGNEETLGPESGTVREMFPYFVLCLFPQ